MTPDYFVRYLPFPARVGAVVVPNDDGSFDIYISSRLSDEARKQRLAHELSHIREDHFYRPIPVALAEAEAKGTVSTPPPPCLPLSGAHSFGAQGALEEGGGVVSSTPAPVSAPAPAATSADEWLCSWQRAMAWAEEMMKQRGWPDVG